ncbi:hypothetical protein R4Z10_10875 [Niallia sp. XMNu-256]|uniref:hypothetical protein n=1 Tax=Niallia sp. XMNu-256 TaxID=3082444 RepID=UPI0030CD2A91
MIKPFLEEVAQLFDEQTQVEWQEYLHIFKESKSSDPLINHPFSCSSELAYDQLLQKFEILVIASKVQQKLLEVVLEGCSLSKMLEMFYNITGIPGVIFNVDGRAITSVGLDRLSNGLSSDILFQFVSTQPISFSYGTIHVSKRNQDQCYLLTKDILLNTNKVGSCTIIFKEENESSLELSMNLLEQIAVACPFVSCIKKQTMIQRNK